MDVTTRQLRCFVVLAEELHFRRAAERLYVAQQALSSTIRNLEDRVGAKLVERTTRKVALTAAGRVFLTEAVASLEAFDRGVDRARRASAEQRATLRLGVLAVEAPELTTSILHDFRALHPDVHVEVVEYRYDDPSAGLASASVDVALLRPPIAAAGLNLYELFREPRLLVVREGHRLASRSSVKVADVLEEPMVVAPCPDRVWNDFWLLNAQRLHGSPVVWGEVSSMFEEIEAVRSGRACTNIPRSYAPRVAAPDLRFVVIEDAEPSACAIGWRRDDERPAVAEFVASIRARCEATGWPQLRSDFVAA